MPAPVRKKARKQIPKRVLARLTSPSPSTIPASPSTLPLLSVVIPVYNVERYLNACLESICSQQYKNLEIIIVDDGSTDKSLLIAETYLQRDQRIRIIRQSNAGLGAARNTGIRAARGEFITFADSDDLVPEKAYEIMIESLRASGSDFVVGSLNRLIGSKREVPAWAKKVHASDRKAICIDDFPAVLQDVFAWNKIFRRTFWDEHIKLFPEGVLYEDQEPTARAYLVSSKFDILRDVVYDWRIREDRSSITQNKKNIKDLSDRLGVCVRTRQLLDEQASGFVRDTWLAKVLGPDMGQYYVQVPRTTEAYWDTLRQGIGQIVSTLDPAVLSGLEINHRVMVYLILTGSRDDVIAVATHQSEYGSKYPIVKYENQLLAQPTYLDSLITTIPNYILEISRADLKIKSRITSIDQLEPRIISVKGYAYIEGLQSDSSVRISTTLVETTSGASISLPTRLAAGFDVDLVANDPWVSYASAYFETELDFDKAIIENPHATPGSEWALEVTVDEAGETVTGHIEGRDMSGTAATLPLIATKNGTRHIFRFSHELGLSLIPMAYKRFVTDAAVTNREIDLTIELPASETASILRLESPDARVSRDIYPASGHEPNKFNFILPAMDHESVTTNTRWKVRVGTSDGKFHHLAWAGTTPTLRGLADNQSQNVVLGSTGYGYVELFDRPWQIFARSVQISSDAKRVTIDGTATYSDASSSARLHLPRLLLASSHRIVEPQSTTWLGDNRFSVQFATDALGLGATRLALEPGLYTLRAHTTPDLDTSSTYWVPVSFDLEQKLPYEQSNDEFRIRVSRTPKAAALALSFSPPFDTQERGKLRQTRLQAQIPALIKPGVVTNATLFESFGGTGVSDSGLGIFNDMIRRGDNSPKYWSVKDASVPVPDGSERLIRFSRRWYEVLHTAGYVVNNSHFPFFYRKNAGQKYIQTWHGTPLKRIANDIPTSSLSLAYLGLMKRESEYWDYLLAQNEFAAKTLPSAFGYDGEVLNLGYPRNDSLAAGQSPRRRQEVRASLGLRPDQTVVLYAPTWRDNIRSFNNQYMLADFMDYEVAGEVLGQDFVFLLRGHSNVSVGRDPVTQAGVIDVTSYPNINDLFLAADILVTDYSSVMFDFCVTDKPIYFLTPDLDEYRDHVRGFYFDFEKAAPGPLCSNTRSLAEAIRDDVSSQQFQEKYSAFKTRFAPRDDGNASSRIYEAIWLR